MSEIGPQRATPKRLAALKAEMNAKEYMAEPEINYHEFKGDFWCEECGRPKFEDRHQYKNQEEHMEAEMLKGWREQESRNCGRM